MLSQTRAGKRPLTIMGEDLRSVGDSKLIAQLCLGDGEALNLIVERYSKLVFSVALRILQNVSEAEDLTQSVFLEIFCKPTQFDPARGTLKMWVLQFTYSRSINRRHYLEQRGFYAPTDLSDVNPVLITGAFRSFGLSSSEIALVVRRALTSLSEKQQTAIKLVYFQGLTLAEAAESTGETLTATRHHYYRGLLKMRKFISTGATAVQYTRQATTRREWDVL